MSKQQTIMNSVNRKFSISLLKLNQTTQQSQKDDLYEFNAPKYFDLSTLPESPVGNDLKVDPWFFIDHSNQTKHIKQLKNPTRKKKYSQYQRENNEDNSRNNDFKIDKRNKSTFDNRKDKKSIVKTLETLTLSKERTNNFKRNQSIAKTFNNIKKLKRGVSTDTYTYYNSKLSKEGNEKENIEGNSKRNTTKIKITYCPRVHDAKLMKKWEDKKGLKWYSLSPESRAKANDEISSMIKTNAFNN